MQPFKHLSVAASFFLGFSCLGIPSGDARQIDWSPKIELAAQGLEGATLKGEGDGAINTTGEKEEIWCGDGADTVVLSGRWSDYHILYVSTDPNEIILHGPAGTKHLYQCQTLEFDHLTLPVAALHDPSILDPKTFPAYVELRRDILINSDLWTDQPEILSAGYGFEGIQGIPTLLSAANLQAAVDAGAGVNLDWAELDPLPPLRNLTSGAGSLGIGIAGFGAFPLFADAMPIVFSWPILPSTVSPTAFALTLNTGQVVTPTAAALNPNYDYNERHVVVVFGQFGNRLAPGEPGAVYPVTVTVVEGDTSLKAVGPNGPVSIVGLSSPSSNPYVAGPELVGAKLTQFSQVGDFAPPALSAVSPNDGFAHFGEAAEYRLRLFTSGGFSPDGVSGLLPDDFERFFRLHATDAAGDDVMIDRERLVYDLGVGQLEIIGMAELGEPAEPPYDRAYYLEDHDNYFDIIIRGDEAAVERLTYVEIPTSAVPGYFDIYNPGGPGRTPNPETVYTKPAIPQLIPVFVSLDDLRTVSYAEQNLFKYDPDDQHDVVFRLRDPNGPDRFTISSIEAADWVAQGLTAAGVDFPNEADRPGVTQVKEFIHEQTGERIYTLDPDELSALAAPESGWLSEGRSFGAFASPQLGAGPIHRYREVSTGRRHFTPDETEFAGDASYEYEGVAWYAAVLRPSLPPIERWRLEYFGDASNSGPGADDADPHGDGIPNVLKYGLVIDPTRSARDRMPRPEVTETGDGPRLTLQFLRDPMRADVKILVEGSDDLHNWTIVVESVEGEPFDGPGEVVENPGPDGLIDVTVRDTVTVSTASKRFLRIRVD